jgi:hypothetical protein
MKPDTDIGNDESLRSDVVDPCAHTARAAYLRNAEIDVYGGDPAFHPIEGTNPTAS